MRRVPTALHWPVFDKTYCLAALIVDTDVVNERCRQAVICCSQVTSHPARVCLDRPTLSVSQPQRRAAAAAAAGVWFSGWFASQD